MTKFFDVELLNGSTASFAASSVIVIKEIYKNGVREPNVCRLHFNFPDGSGERLASVCVNKSREDAVSILVYPAKSRACFTEVE